MSGSRFTSERPMRVILLTQDDVFYLPDAVNLLLSRMPENIRIEAAVILPVSPFGKKEGFLAKSLRTFRIFGPAFFMHYAFKYLKAKLQGRSIKSVIDAWGVKKIELDKSINAEASLDLLASFKPDIMVSIAANEIFKQPLIDLAPLGILNLHTALLPKYRGLMPTFWVLKNGERKTGVSVFLVDEGIDSGPIVVQESITIADQTQEQLIRDTKMLGMEAIISALKKIADGEPKLIDNDPDSASYFRFPDKDDVKQFRRIGARFF